MSTSKNWAKLPAKADNIYVIVNAWQKCSWTALHATYWCLQPHSHLSSWYHCVCINFSIIHITGTLACSSAMKPVSVLGNAKRRQRRSSLVKSSSYAYVRLLLHILTLLLFIYGVIWWAGVYQQLMCRNNNCFQCVAIKTKISKWDYINKQLHISNEFHNLHVTHCLCVPGIWFINWCQQSWIKHKQQSNCSCPET